MKKITLISSFLLLLVVAKAQDKIITVNRDTIHCALLSVGNDRILYDLKKSDGSISGRNIPISEVAEYSLSSLPAKVPEYGIAKKPENESPTGKPWCLGLNAGVSIMPWFPDFGSSTVMANYYEKLKTGFNINVGAYYMIHEFFGVGAEYSFFRIKKTLSVPAEFYTSYFWIGSEKYRIYINYPGVSVLFRQHLDMHGKLNLSESLTTGVLFFRMENQNTYPDVTEYGYMETTNNYLLTGNSFCQKLGVDLEYRLTNALSAGLGADSMWSLLKNATVESKGNRANIYSGNKEEFSNDMKLSRINFSLVMRYCF